MTGDAIGPDPLPPAGGAEREEPQAEREIALRAERIRQLSDELRATKKELRRAQRGAARAEAELKQLRARRSVRIALGLAARAKRLTGGAAAAARTARHAFDRPAPARSGPQVIRATEAEEHALRARLGDVLLPARTSGPLVSIVIVNRDGVRHLRRLLPALGRLAYDPFEVILVDNASTDASVAYAEGLATRFPLRVIRNDSNHSFSHANNQGAAIADGSYILLLNNDTEPAGPHVLGHLVERLETDDALVAVGARLLYPRRAGPTTGPGGLAADLTLQHRGIQFETVDGVPIARNAGAGEDPLGARAAQPGDVAACTAACMLVRSAAFREVGGLAEGYDYGSEDVDLALKLTAAGGRIAYEPQATFWHYESATQHAEDRDSRMARQTGNRRVLADRWGPRIFRETFIDRLEGGGHWADGPLHVGITVTRDDPSAGYGDWYTAHELGDSLAALGWRVSYLERFEEHWYAPDPSLDVVVGLLDAMDIRRLPDGVVTVAWVRNWTHRWIEQPWFDEYDLVLASSHASKALIDAGSVHVAEVFPIATNPERFQPPGEPAEPAVDVLLVANRWGEPRDAEAAVTHLAASGHRVRVHGRGWEDAALGSLAHGPIPYDDLPAAYARAAIVLDDAAGPTRPYGSVNTRVFDALAAGAMVVTDNTIGAAELFDGLLPAADSTAGVVDLVETWLSDPAARAARVAALRAIVLERHTYALRAARLRELLAGWARRPRLDIAIGPPTWDVAPRWGDFHFGRALQRALIRRGYAARIRLEGAWEDPGSARADIAIQVFGLKERRRRSGQVSVLWIISHPLLVTDAMLEAADLVLVASDPFAAQLGGRTTTPVIPLHQATDPERFAPREGGPHHDLLFVANSRNVRRRIVDELTPTDRDLAVYGAGWAPELLAPEHLRGTHVRNEDLAAYYAAADIVLNDHWGDMAEHGFMSNRLYDASAAGAFVISDEVEGLDAEFDGGIPTFRAGDELRRLVDRYLADPGARATHARRARAAVVARHTFAHRAETIDRLVRPLLDEAAARRPAPVEPAR